MTNVFVAIGSNVDPEKHVAQAMRAMSQVFPGTRFSSSYRNRAVGFDGDDFINCVAGFSTDLLVHAVVERLQAIEALCGRPRDAPRWAPRTMDLDILLYDDLVCDEPKLKLPRPDLLKRAFMLGPLAELAPDVVHPTEGITMGELWHRFDREAHVMEKLPRNAELPLESHLGSTPVLDDAPAAAPAPIVGPTSQYSGPHPPPESDP